MTKRAIRNSRYEKPASRPASIKLRPAVLKFAEAMEIKLRKHDVNKGKVPGKSARYDHLLYLANVEMAKLMVEDAYDNGLSEIALKGVTPDPVDLANFALMLWRCRGDA